MNFIFQNPRTGRWWAKSKYSAFARVICDDPAVGLSAHDVRILAGFRADNTLVISWEEANHVA